MIKQHVKPKLFVLALLSFGVIVSITCSKKEMIGKIRIGYFVLPPFFGPLLKLVMGPQATSIGKITSGAGGR